jgi:hypothetical protein
MKEVVENDCNLNISRYISIAEEEIARGHAQRVVRDREVDSH